MITKQNYVRHWLIGTKEDRIQLRNSVVVSNDWDDNWTDRGVSFFIGSIAEMLTKEILQDSIKNYGTYSDYIFFWNDTVHPDFKNCADFVNEDNFPLEAKFTRRSLKKAYENEERYPVEGFFGLAPTYGLPRSLEDKAIKEGARYLVVLDNIRFVNDVNDDYYGDLTSYKYCNLIQFDLTNHTCKVLAEEKKVYDLIKQILTF